MTVNIPKTDAFMQRPTDDWVPPPLRIPHPLQQAFDGCIRQVTKGKGERHGGDATPFFDPPWYAIAKQTGHKGLIFQAMKKAGESCGKIDQEAFERELLGAIAYLGMAYVFVQKDGFKE